MGCAFCGFVTPDDTYDRIAALDVCPTCRSEGVMRHLREKGYEASSRYHVSRGGGQHPPHHYQEVDITLPVCTGLTLRCVRERWYHQMVKLFRNELQVGDPFFDAHIFISKGSSAAVADLLSHEGIQSAILAVGVQGTFQLEGDQLTARTSSAVGPSADDVRVLAIEMAGAALHMTAWQRAR